MTEADERQAKALALLDHQEAQGRLTHRRDAATSLSLELRGLADLLVATPTNIAVDVYEDILNMEKLRAVVSDIRTAEADLAKTADRVAAYNRL
jgi:hypothetical protein